MNNLIWYLIAGTKGGETRARMIHQLEKEPLNANKLSEKLKLDYKTIRHHLSILEKNNLIIAINKGNYGAVYFLSEFMKSNKEDFGKIWKQFGNDLGKH